MQHDPDFADYARNFPQIIFPSLSATTQPPAAVAPPHYPLNTAATTTTNAAAADGAVAAGAALPALTSPLGNKYSGDHDSSS